MNCSSYLQVMKSVCDRLGTTSIDPSNIDHSLISKNMESIVHGVETPGWIASFFDKQLKAASKNFKENESGETMTYGEWFDFYSYWNQSIPDMINKNDDLKNTDTKRIARSIQDRFMASRVIENNLQMTNEEMERISMRMMDDERTMTSAEQMLYQNMKMKDILKEMKDDLFEDNHYDINKIEAYVRFEKSFLVQGIETMLKQGQAHQINLMHKFQEEFNT